MKVTGHWRTAAILTYQHQISRFPSPHASPARCLSCQWMTWTDPACPPSLKDRGSSLPFQNQKNLENSNNKTHMLRRCLQIQQDAKVTRILTDQARWLFEWVEVDKIPRGWPAPGLTLHYCLKVPWEVPGDTRTRWKLLTGVSFSNVRFCCILLSPLCIHA